MLFGFIIYEGMPLNGDRMAIGKSYRKRKKTHTLIFGLSLAALRVDSLLPS